MHAAILNYFTPIIYGGAPLLYNLETKREKIVMTSAYYRPRVQTVEEVGWVGDVTCALIPPSSLLP